MQRAELRPSRSRSKSSLRSAERAIALCLLLSTVATTLLDWQIKAIAKHAYAGDADRMAAFFGSLFTYQSGLSLAFQLLITGWLLKRLKMTFPTERMRPLLKAELDMVRATIYPVVEIEVPGRAPFVLDEQQEKIVAEAATAIAKTVTAETLKLASGQTSQPWRRCISAHVLTRSAWSRSSTRSRSPGPPQRTESSPTASSARRTRRTDAIV